MLIRLIASGINVVLIEQHISLENIIQVLEHIEDKTNRCPHRNQVDFDVYPVIEDDTLISFRSIAEALKAQVIWNENDKSINSLFRGAIGFVGLSRLNYFG